MAEAAAPAPPTRQDLQANFALSVEQVASQEASRCPCNQAPLTCPHLLQHQRPCPCRPRDPRALQTYGISFGGRRAHLDEDRAAQGFGGPAGQIVVMHRILVDAEAVDQRGALPARAEVLHAPARARGAAARLLRRLAAAPDGGRNHRWCAVRPPLASSPSSRSASRTRLSARHPKLVKALLYAACRPSSLSSRPRCCASVSARSRTAPCSPWPPPRSSRCSSSGVPFPIIIALAAVIGWIGGQLRPDLFVVIKGHNAGTETSAAPMISDDALAHTRRRAGVMRCVHRRLLADPVVGAGARAARHPRATPCVHARRAVLQRSGRGHLRRRSTPCSPSSRKRPSRSSTGSRRTR